ncbi:MAG: glycosyltransferase [Prochlorococcus marinus CUG1439]|uniref:glycosyltransferase n=1 Tax=Prochlorococcus sp. MIT 1314 TaxID=3096220 RepID=UPI001B2BF11C|nr:glycosyltransferase [Prochlorococcus sp. MIT 1314]MCR8538802.1 glycosyltransferase [Prochlorococcus marinus CUG1439]
MELKKITYVSSSEIPSNSANSIQVIRQCFELSKLGYEIDIYFSTKIEKKFLKKEIKKKYGLSHVNFILNPTKTYLGITNNFFILINFCLSLISKKNLGTILTRNFYVSFLLTLLKKKHIFEVHHVEENFMKRFLQIFAISGKDTKVVYISDALRTFMSKKIRKKKLSSFQIVLPDASDIQSNKALFPEYLHFDSLIDDMKSRGFFICGYFGTLNMGKGVERIIDISQKDKNNFFIIAGSGEASKYLKNKKFKNLIYLGCLPCDVSRHFQRKCNVLLMPYQKIVKVGSRGLDTARWMSPLKMFEYMSTNVPIISSDLNVIKEVLSNEINCILCSAENTEMWVKSIKRLKEDNKLGSEIANNAFKDLISKYTWDIRTKKLISLISKN